jgi:hypothetical protein
MVLAPFERAVKRPRSTALMSAADSQKALLMRCSRTVSGRDVVTSVFFVIGQVLFALGRVAL